MYSGEIYIMKEIIGDLWTFENKCITTNGMLTKQGLAIMGKGIALEARLRHPDLPYILGQLIKEKGNHVYFLKIGYFSFPTKNDWKNNSSLELIERSCIELIDLVNDPWYQITEVVLPKPGCGNGGLDWKVVKPILEKYLDDRFSVISKK